MPAPFLSKKRSRRKSSPFCFWLIAFSSIAWPKQRRALVCRTLGKGSSVSRWGALLLWQVLPIRQASWVDNCALFAQCAYHPDQARMFVSQVEVVDSFR